jgi:hypothetical protein
VSTDDKAVLSITGTPEGGSGTDATLESFDDSSPATPPLEISFTNETTAATATDGLEVRITGGTIDGSSNFDQDSRTFTTTLSANGNSGDSATITVDNDTGGTESVDLEVVSADFDGGASISLTRNNVVIGSPVTNLTTPDTTDPSVTSGNSLDITVDAQDDQDGDPLTNIDISGTTESTTDVDVTFADSTRSTGDSSSSVTFSPKFDYTGESSSGDAKLKFSAGGESTTLTVTVDSS